MAGNCLLLDGETPRLHADGTPEIRTFVFPKGDFEILDTWNTTGLRGTGSNDFAVRDVFVPAQRTFSMVEEAPRSVFAASLLDRQFRDIHTLAQHGALAPITLEPAGRMLLGLEASVPLF